MKINCQDINIKTENGTVSIEFNMSCDAFLRLVEDLKKNRPEKKVIIRDTVVSNETKKQKLFAQVALYKDKYPGSYPIALYNKFMKYWTEEKINGNGIRIDKEEYFEIGKRLATFWGFVPTEDKSKMWEEDKKQEQQKQNTLL